VYKSKKWGLARKPHARLAIVEIEKLDTPFGPPLDRRVSPEELKQTVTLTPLTKVRVGQYFYMQLFENTLGNSVDTKE